MRRIYALGALGATTVAAALGLKVTEARANPCPVPSSCSANQELWLFNCASDICGDHDDYSHLSCGICVTV